MRLGPLALVLFLLAAVVALDSLDDVGAQVYAQNATGSDATVQVAVSLDGRPRLDAERLIPAGGNAFVGEVHGPPGEYAWAVAFGNRTAQGGDDFGHATLTMNVVLFPDDLEVSFSIA